MTAACSFRESPEQRRSEADSAAGRAGQLAHKMAEKAAKNSREISRQMMKAAHDAHEGWKAEGQKSKDKK